MTEQHPEHVGGKGFSPTERNVDESDEHAATVTHGGGKQFAQDVQDPDVHSEARQTEGSGKQFAWDVPGDEPTDATDDHAAEDDGPVEHARGSGTQFEPPERER